MVSGISGCAGAAAAVAVAVIRSRMNGARALELWFPGLKGAPGNWLKADDGAEVLVTYSPEFILRFRTVTPEVQQIKKAMWVAIKSVLKKV